MSRENTLCWVWFQQIFGYGSTRAEEILAHYGSPAHIYNSDLQTLAVSGIFKRQELTRLAQTKQDVAERIVADCQRLGCNIVTPDDPEYPEQLKNIYSRPCVLYVQGSMEGIEDKLAIGMVGTRQCTPYGKQVADMLSRELAACGVVVVSGLAVGIDTVCHVGALKGGGRTIAVTGCGCDINYPAANRELRGLIIKNGAVISEYPPGTPSLAHHFPIRNRIISGLSQGVVVVEGERRSGSLISAGHALTQGRDVFAVPGSIFSTASTGTHWLLRQGAVPVTCTADILEEYLPLYAEKLDIQGIEMQQKKKHTSADQTQPAQQSLLEASPPVAAGKKQEASAPKPPAPLYLTTVQRQLYQKLESSAKTVDTLTAELGIPVQEVLSALTQMEIYGLVTAHPGRKFSLML